MEVKHQRIKLFVRENTTHANKLLVLEQFYRDEMRNCQIAGHLAKQNGRKSQDFWCKKMKTLWGGCNPDAKTIWLNLELVKKNKECLKYIVIHELMHSPLI